MSDDYDLLAEGEAQRSRVTEARAAIDRGDMDSAIRIVCALAIEDRTRSIPYDVRMRWYEVVGRIEDAGAKEKLRASFNRCRGCGCGLSDPEAMLCAPCVNDCADDRPDGQGDYCYQRVDEREGD